MKSKLLYFLAASMLFLMPAVNFGQTVNLGSAAGFALFTAAGAFTNSGEATVVTGDVGTNVGAFSAFPPGTLIGQIHVADPASAQAASDVKTAYGNISAITCGSVISTTMGGGQILLPNVYCLGAASTIDGDLTLDGQGDPNSIFIFLINGALATTVGSRVLFTNSASSCNVYWQVNGEVDLGENSHFQGTILADGAINLLEAATLNGRGLSEAGAISLHDNIVTTCVCGAPTNVTFSKISRNKVQMCWNSECCALGYLIKWEVSTRNKWQYRTVNAPDTCTIFTFLAGQTDQVYIAAICSSGDTSAYSQLYVYPPQSRTDGDIKQEGEFSVFPNPTSGHIMIVLNNEDLVDQPVTIELVNVFGQIVVNDKSELVNGSMAKSLELSSGLAAGVYMLNVILDSKILHQQIIYAGK